MGKLVLFMDDGTTKAINLAKERVVIGRRPDNDLCLPYPAVSGEHAAVVTILDDSFLEDLNSTNGTLVNGAAVQKHFLRDRDQIDIGRQKLVYLSDETAQLEPDNVRAVRNELKMFGERVEPVAPPPLREYVPDDIEIELRQDAVARAKPRKQADAPRKASQETRAARAGATSDDAAPLRGDEPSVPSPGNEPAKPAPSLPAVDDVPSKTSLPMDDAGRERVTTSAAKSGADSVGDRASTNRALDRMARIRSGETSNGDAHGNSDEPRADSLSERPSVRRASQPMDALSQRARVTVLSGASAGRSLIIERDEVVIGRVGVQVAAIGRSADGYRLQAREGDSAPLLNGSPLAADGARLKSGDIFEVAGARLEFIAAK
jgi:pSer/pThr/pTyr-binding forkhead associated (FHA) protein